MNDIISNFSNTHNNTKVNRISNNKLLTNCKFVYHLWLEINYVTIYSKALQYGIINCSLTGPMKLMLSVLAYTCIITKIDIFHATKEKIVLQLIFNSSELVLAVNHFHAPVHWSHSLTLCAIQILCTYLITSTSLSAIFVIFSNVYLFTQSS